MSARSIRLAIGACLLLLAASAGAAIATTSMQPPTRPVDTSGAVIARELFQPVGEFCMGIADSPRRSTGRTWRTARGFGCGTGARVTTTSPAVRSDAVLRLHGTVQTDNGSTQVRAWAKIDGGDRRGLAPGVYSLQGSGNQNVAGAWRLPNIPAGARVTYGIDVTHVSPDNDTTVGMLRTLVEVEYSAARP